MKFKLFLSILMIGLVITLTGCSTTPGNNQTSTNASNKADEIPAGMIFFYGKTCPHCKIVEQYIQENNVTAKIFFSQLEVYDNVENAKTLEKVAEKCSIPTSQLGVPLFWDGQKCLIGDVDITNYFKSKIQS